MTLSFQCGTCRHKRPPSPEGPSCEAFPNGIPVEIFNGSVNHSEPVEGDNDIQWVPRPGLEYLDRREAV